MTINFKRNYFKYRKSKEEVWSVGGICHRDPKDGPARLEYDTHNNLISAQFMVFGKFCRDREHGPAVIYYHNNRVKKIIFFDNGAIHRPAQEGPAVIEFDNFGREQWKEYWERGQIIRCHIYTL